MNMLVEQQKTHGVGEINSQSCGFNWGYQYKSLIMLIIWKIMGYYWNIWVCQKNLTSFKWFFLTLSLVFFYFYRFPKSWNSHLHQTIHIVVSLSDAKFNHQFYLCLSEYRVTPRPHKMVARPSHKTLENGSRSQWDIILLLLWTCPTLYDANVWASLKIFLFNFHRFLSERKILIIMGDHGILNE